MCDRHHPQFYTDFKRWCDEYFVNTHRDNEARGVGGIFFDHLRPSEENGLNHEQIAAFVTDVARSLRHAYEPIVDRRRDEPFSSGGT
jgi:coproporphyrinogen III oxidase